MLVEDSSTNTSRLGSTDLKRSRQAPRAFSSRSEAPAIFFSGPTEPAHRPTHRRHRHPHAPPLLPKLAVALERGVVVLFELRPQSAPLIGGGKYARRPARRGLGRQAPSPAAALEPALEGGQGYAEGADRLLSGHPAVEGGQRFQPEVLRVGVHAPILARSSSVTQTALVQVRILVRQPPMSPILWGFCFSGVSLDPRGPPSTPTGLWSRLWSKL